MTKEQVEYFVKGIREMADFCNLREGCYRCKEGKLIDKCPMYDQYEQECCSMIRMFKTIVDAVGKFNDRVRTQAATEAENEQ